MEYDNDQSLQRNLLWVFKKVMIREIAEKKRRLVEVPHTASLSHTMNVLVANRVVAVPVAAPPGQWIGAGGSMIMESDKHTGAVRKHYIGMVTMLDMLTHIAGDDDRGDGESVSGLDQRLAVPVSNIIGRCLESLSLWTFGPNTSILDCMEVFSKGIHRAMVPLDSNMDNVAGVELVESSSCYKMVTQMDIVKFVKQYAAELKAVLSRTVTHIGAITNTIFSVTDRTKAIDAIRCMRTGSLHAVPIVEASDDLPQEANTQLINGYGRKLVGTFSATDLRACPIDRMQSWLSLDVVDFTERVYANPSYGAPDLVNSPRLLVTCYPESTLEEVMDKVVAMHVHRVWVLDRDGLLIGLASLTDLIRAVWVTLLSQS
ncbi:hypothetical protein Droror1_Dr00008135 [Drosera rotundifolia]